MRSLICSLLLLPHALSGCSDVSISVAPEVEGDDPGECSDTADNDGDGLFDCDDQECSGAPECTPNSPPGQPAVRVDPYEPKTTDTLSCVIDIASFDPDGDAVEYEFSWSLDGVDTELADVNIDPEMTAKGQTWTCSVIPTDALGNVGPGASAAETILNTGPTAPVVVISPNEPVVANSLQCTIESPSYDADGDEVTYSYTWLKDGGPLGVLVAELEWTVTEVNDEITCIASPWDGFEDGPVGQSSVVVHQDAKLWVSAGRDHTCSNQSDLSYACWGSNSHGQSEQGPSFNYYQLEVGGDFTCGIVQNSGGVECWGDQAANQHLGPLGSFVDLGVGEGHACAVNSLGEVVVWGSGLSWSDPPPWTELQVAVSAGQNYCCAISTLGQLGCWGDGKPVPGALGSYTAVAAGTEHVCGLDDGGQVSCFGDDTWGQVSTTPPDEFVFLNAGHRHTCAIEAVTGFVHCWGDNTHGQLDAPTGQFSQVSAGWYHSCGKRPNDLVECWGCVGDDSGQCDSTIN